MRLELQEKIFKEFDLMFSERHLSMMKTTMCWGLEVGDGWYDLIYDVCKKIQPLVSPEFRFTQVKEKYGQLEMYTYNASDEISDIIDEASEKSLTVCEKCAEEGKLIENESHWFRVRCNKCWEELQTKLSV